MFKYFEPNKIFSITSKAFDVIEKILFGSKYLNIYEIIFIMKKLPDQECQREIITKGK